MGIFSRLRAKADIEEQDTPEKNRHKEDQSVWLLAAANPAEYIDRSLKLSLSPAEKSRLTRIWLEKTGFSSRELRYERHRHPYWKKKKMHGHQERNLLRRTVYNYGTGRKRWTIKDTRFLVANNSLKDYELAKELQRSLPSIQSKRRQLNALLKLNRRQKVVMKREQLAKILLLSERAIVTRLRMAETEGRTGKKYGSGV